MAKTITQKVLFKNTTPKKLYNLYMDAKQHSMISGGPAKISAKAGTKYSVHGGYITGENLQLIKDKMIIQSWRASEWNKDDQDSVFIINLEPKGKDVILHVVHANVPDQHAKNLAKGWNDHYWKPWKQHLAGKIITRPKM